MSRDSETGQDYAQARNYSASTGRFNRVDPVYAGLLNPQLWNRYAYALNNPVRFTDPDGREVKLCGEFRFCSTVTGELSEELGLRGGGGTGDDLFLEIFEEGPNLPEDGGGPGERPAPRPGPGPAPGPGPNPPGPGPGPTPEPPSCNAVTGEGCNRSASWARLKGFFQGAWESIPGLGTSEAESCLVFFAKDTIRNMAPFVPGVASVAEPAAEFGAQYQMNRALRYAASRPNYLGGQGLLVPLRSKTFREMLGKSRAIARGGGLVLSEGLAIAQSLENEWDAWKSGKCR